jgi:hypothetical protein
MEEDVPGLSATDLEDKIHFFSKSSFNIEQIRPIERTAKTRPYMIYGICSRHFN